MPKHMQSDPSKPGYSPLATMHNLLVERGALDTAAWLVEHGSFLPRFEDAAIPPGKGAKKPPLRRGLPAPVPHRNLKALLRPGHGLGLVIEYPGGVYARGKRNGEFLAARSTPGWMPSEGFAKYESRRIGTMPFDTPEDLAAVYGSKEALVETDAAEPEAVFQALGECTARWDRFGINGAYYDLHHGRLVATNGNVLAWLPVHTMDIPPSAQKTLPLIPGEVLANVSKKTPLKLHRGKEGRNTAYLWSAGGVFGRGPEGYHFPDYMQVIPPKRSTWAVSFHIRTLWAICQRTTLLVKAWSDKRMHHSSFVVSPNSEAVTLRATYTETDAEGAVVQSHPWAENVPVVRWFGRNGSKDSTPRGQKRAYDAGKELIRLVALAWRVVGPDGRLVLEGGDDWIQPTHFTIKNASGREVEGVGGVIMPVRMD